MQLNNKNIVLTGASSGIGKEILTLLSGYEGVRIVCVARNVSTIEPVEGRIYPFAADLSAKEGIDTVFDYALTIFGGIDIFIANAGFGYLEKIDKPDWEHINKIYSLNVFSTIYSMEKLLSETIGKDKLFVSTNSCVAMVSLPGYAFYCSTKAALRQFMLTFRYEDNPGFRVMNVYPIATKTKFFDKAADASQTPLPWPSQSAGKVAKAVIKGIEKDKKEVYPSLLFRLSYPLGRAFPFLLKLYSLNEKRKVRKWIGA